MNFSQMNNEWMRGEAEYMDEHFSQPSSGFFMHIRGDEQAASNLSVFKNMHYLAWWKYNITMSNNTGSSSQWH